LLSESFPILIANKIFHFLLLLYQFLADVTAVFVNNQHGIQLRAKDFAKKSVYEEVHSKEIDRQIYGKKAG